MYCNYLKKTDKNKSRYNKHPFILQTKQPKNEL